jgi:hypothetical protein
VKEFAIGSKDEQRNLNKECYFNASSKEEKKAKNKEC